MKTNSTWSMILLLLGCAGWLGCSSEGGDSEDGGDGGLPACGTGSDQEFMACVERDRYLADLEFVAAERDPGSAHWQAVQDLCAERFEELGFTVERHVYDTGVNVIGVLEGGAKADERVLVSAHYDHIPGCPGADDNGTGVAGILETARVLATGSFDRTLVVACWDEEELGLVGSRAYAARANENGEVIKDNFVYEMIGYKDDAPDTQDIPGGLEYLFPEELEALEADQRRGDFIALIADFRSEDATEDMARLAEKIDLDTVVLNIQEDMEISPLLGDLQRSDHAAFWYRGYPGIMITDTSEFRNEAYHCAVGTDEVSRLDHDFATQVVQVTAGAAALALGIQ